MMPRMPLTKARAGEVRSAFSRGPKERPLRLVVDYDRIIPGDASELLAGFVGHPNVEMWSTRDDGQPHVQLDWTPRSDDKVRVHWTSNNTHRSLSGVWFASQYRLAAREAVSHRHAVDEEAAYRELILAAACSECSIDALVTDSAFLLGRPRGVRGNPMRPAAAVASLGLFLRLRGDFHIGRHLTLDRGMFYETAAWELLPEAWRCVSACRAAGQTVGRDSFWILARAVVERMERALRARDRLHEQFQVPQNNDTADEALFYLDMLLIQLGGAFDALARVAHLGFGLPGTHHHASWRHTGWLHRLGRQAPALAALMAEETEERDALELVALLRNSVHGEPFTTIARQHAGQIHKFIQLPQDDIPRFLAAVGRQGGEAAWGIHPAATPGGIMVEADTYVEALLPAVARSLNAVMRATEVERFTGIPPGWVTPPWPTSDAEELEIRAAVRQLAGLVEAAQLPMIGRKSGHPLSRTSHASQPIHR
jgi:hypothetical protein